MPQCGKLTVRSGLQIWETASPTCRLPHLVFCRSSVPTRLLTHCSYTARALVVGAASDDRSWESSCLPAVEQMMRVNDGLWPG